MMETAETITFVKIFSPVGWSLRFRVVRQVYDTIAHSTYPCPAAKHGSEERLLTLPIEEIIMSGQIHE